MATKDTRTGKLKQKLKNDYGENLKFLPQTGRNETEIVIGTGNIDKFITCSDKKTLEMQPKAVGLHDLTGSRKVVDIVYGLGHCLSYNLAMYIKTGVAEQVLQKITDTEILSLQPLSEESIVPTSFWVDNFDLNIDSLLNQFPSLHNALPMYRFAYRQHVLYVSLVLNNQ